MAIEEAESLEISSCSSSEVNEVPASKPQSLVAVFCATFHILTHILWLIPKARMILCPCLLEIYALLN